MGGTVEQMIALDYADAINKVALLSTSAKWSEATLLALESHIKLKEKGVDPELYANILLSWLFGETFLSSLDMRQGFIENAIDTFDAQTFEDQRRQYQALVDFDNKKNLPDIQAETLIVTGSQDLLASPAESANLAKRIPNSQLQHLVCGHALTFEKPEELSKILLDFLG